MNTSTASQQPLLFADDISNEGVDPDDAQLPDGVDEDLDDELIDEDDDEDEDDDDLDDDDETAGDEGVDDPAEE